MAKTMETIRFFRRWWDNPTTRNPTIGSIPHITEVSFTPFMNEVGEKMVTIRVIDWRESVTSVRTGPNDWEKRVEWVSEISRDFDTTPSEANKHWKSCKTTPYATQKIPAELVGRF